MWYAAICTLLRLASFVVSFRLALFYVISSTLSLMSLQSPLKLFRIQYPLDQNLLSWHHSKAQTTKVSVTPCYWLRIMPFCLMLIMDKLTYSIFFYTILYYNQNWLLVESLTIICKLVIGGLYTSFIFLVYKNDSSPIGWTFILMVLDCVTLSLLRGVSHNEIDPYREQS